MSELRPNSATPPDPPAETPTAMQLNAGLRLGNFRIVRMLGEGGMGFVYEAEDETLGRRVAVKVMRPEIAAQPDNRERFLREARAAARLSHDRVVPIYHVGEHDGTPYIVMPLLAGRSLAGRLKADGRLAPAEVVRIAREVAEGLAAAHAVGLIHRDVKPENVWLKAPGDAALLLDFGIARSVEGSQRLTETGAILGTPAYMAPEVVEGAPPSAGSDVFALGTMLYEMASGTHPFTGATALAVLYRVVNHTPQSPANMPAGLADLVMRLLAKDPARRPTANEAVAELRAMDGTDRNSTTPFVPHPLISPQPNGRNRGPKWMALAFGFGVLVCLVLAATFWPRPTPTDRSQPPEDTTQPQANAANVVPKPVVPERQEHPPKAPDGKENRLAGFTNHLGMTFVPIPKGTAMLGGGGGTPGTQAFTLKDDIFCGTHEITQKQWQAVMGSNPSQFKDNQDAADCPVECVSYTDIETFLEKLNAAEKTHNSGRTYRLPTEQEWEYICRGGPVSGADSAYHFYCGTPSNDLSGHDANFDANFPAGTAPKLADKYLKRTCQGRSILTAS